MNVDKTISELNGYKKGERYEKYLKAIGISGNSNKRIIVMQDKEGNEFLWNTTDYNSVYKEFEVKGIYKFTVNSFLEGDTNGRKSRIVISRLAFIGY